jgi:dCTP deaminase
MEKEDKSTKVGTLSDEDIKFLCSKGELVNANYNEKNINQACYELRASNIYYDLVDPTHHKKIELKNDEYILLKPKQLVVIITLESLSLPNDILGRILTKGKLFSIGLLPVNTYADPGFYGNLGIVFYNLSNNYLKIHPGEAIAKIEFSKLMRPVKQTYRGQHGYQTKIWPIPTEMILSLKEALKDNRVKSPEDELTLSYGKDIGNVIKRVFKFEKYILLSALSYFLLFLVIIYAIKGTELITPLNALLIGVISNLTSMFLIYLATNIRRR